MNLETMNNNCSVIITFKNGDKYRLRNLLFILEYLNNFTFVNEVIIVECDIHKCNLDIFTNVNYNYKCKYLFYQSDIFKKSLCCNAGAKEATNNMLLFLDNDVIVSPAILTNIYYNNLDKKVIKPFNRYKALTEEYSNHIIDNKLFDIKAPVKNIIAPIVDRMTAGGMLFIDKDFFWSIKGWNENFIGWGFEDNEFYLRIKSKYSFIEQQADVYHLYHTEQSKSNVTKNFIEYQKTLKNNKKYIYETNVNMLGKII